MIAATTWHGRRGSVLLGPTENRIARFLTAMTANGRVTIRTVDLIKATGLERSEAYRITARLRILGLFGVENDRGGTRGGRRYWRTAIEHDGAGLDPARHRAAWSRIVSWTRARRAHLHLRLAELRAHHTRRVERSYPPLRASTPPGVASTGGVNFADAMRRYGLGPLMDSWARR